MTCRDFIEFLSAYLAGELPADEVAVFNAHLEECPSCVAYLDTYRQAVQLGTAALQTSSEQLPAEVPEELVQAILSARHTSAQPSAD